MAELFDCIVLGVGGFGSGVIDHLARRGAKVLGIERHGIAHDRGSSHGQTRIIRQAYFEHPDYVPLCIAAYDLWRNLESDYGRQLMRLCGLLLSGPEDGAAIAGAKLAARLHGLPIEELTATEASGRFPGFRFPTGDSVVFEANAGFLFVEECVRAHIGRAKRRGAVVRTGEAVRSWRSNGKTVTVTTERGTYTAAKLVITPGAWAGELLPELGVSFQILRKSLFWFESAVPAFLVDHGCPAFLFERPRGVYYGFPSFDGRSMKVAEHSGGTPIADPTTVDRTMHDSEAECVGAFVQSCLPGVSSTPRDHAVCLYTLTPDRHFVIDFHPRYKNVVIGAGFSGHGFKFTPILGQALSELALDGRTDLPIGFLSLDRFENS